MLRWLYIQLIWLHPAQFRWRFGDDMLDDFDRAALRDKPRYFADAAVSLARQWLLRPEFRRPQGTATESSLAPAGAPLFQVIEAYKPAPAALVHGGLLAILSICAATFLIAKGGGVARPYVIGAHFSRPGILPIDRASVTASDLDTAVKVGPEPIEAWLKVARPYFSSMPVLRALDIDGNLTLSPSEIASAPAALRGLDANHLGKLTAEACGLRIDPSSMSAAMAARIRRRFMGYHPALAALDADGDSEISAQEVDHAAAALKSLDRNHDGYLTPDELVPFEMAVRAGLR